MDLKFVFMVSMVLIRIYAMNQGIFKFLEIPSDVWSSMVYKSKILNSTLKRPSLSEIAAYCLIESNCDAFVINGNEIFFIDTTVDQEFLQGELNTKRVDSNLKSYSVEITEIFFYFQTFLTKIS